MKKLNLQTSRNSQHITGRDWSKFGLDTLRKSIDNKHLLDLKIRQEIKLQKQNSAKFVQKIKINVHRTQQNAIEYVTKLEQQIQKNKQLNALVQHYESQIDKLKKQQYQNLMNNVENSQYEQLCNKIETLQKQLGQQARKSNSAISQVQKKYQIVKAQRRERTVFSNMFNNFQNQLFDLQFLYKQLVIERMVWDKTYQRKVEEFQKINKEGQKKIKNFEEKVKTQWFQSQIQSQALNKMQNNSIFFRTRNKIGNIKLQRNQNNRQSQLLENELRCFKKQKIVKQIFYDFNVKNIEDFALVIKNLSSQSCDIISQIQLQNSKINELEERIKNILQLRKTNQSGKQQLSSEQKIMIKNKKKLKKKISKYIQLNQKYKIQMMNLKESAQFLKLGHAIQGHQIGQEDFAHIFAKLDKKLDQITIKTNQNNNSPMKMYKSRLVQQFQIKAHQDSKLPFQSQNSMLNQQIGNIHDIHKSRKKSSINRLKTKQRQIQKQDQFHTEKKIQRQSVKKLSTLIKQAQNKTKNNFFLVSKSQMIKYGLKAFQTEGQSCSNILTNFKVQYA